MRAVTAGTVLATAATGTAGGVFFGFSTFVMAGLQRLPASQGIAAMQSINITAVRPPFMTALFGSAALCAGLGAHALGHRDQPGARLILAASALYLVGTIGLTVAHHVPLNDALAVLDPSDPSSMHTWRSYLSDWTRWNHVRTLSSLAASTLLALSLREPARAALAVHM